MIREPLYTAISEALKKPLDGNLFQACAVSLLMQIHPNLAPMPGGDDDGMDGSFAHHDGPFPLVCTTQKSVIGNFKKNIQRFLNNNPNAPKQAVIATSQTLSNLQKRNIYKAAAALGVTVENIYDGSYFTDRLYDSPHWRKELLGISGKPSALSIYPKRFRQTDSTFLIGRDDDVEWLKAINSDALVVGQPGFGKTYLHQLLAAEGRCLFVVDADPEALADAIRQQKPAIVVVDDAHLAVDQLHQLISMRLQLSAHYQIHANCWPSHAKQVQLAMGIGQQETKRLKRLKREEVHDLIRSVGVIGPDWLLNTIIEQANGKPGLAYVLAKAALDRDLKEIIYGDVLDRELLSNPQVVRNTKEKCILAGFAIGGKQGLSTELVASIFDISPLDLAEITASLGTGGILEEADRERLIVYPEALRGLLIREVFYRGVPFLSFKSVLKQLPVNQATIPVLLHAKQLGADIEDETLEALVKQYGDHGIWEHFAYTNPRNSLSILHHYPNVICETASPLLSHHPLETLDKLLTYIETGTKHKPGDVAHPKRKIHEWIIARDGNAPSTIERRKYLLSAVERKIKNQEVGTGYALAWALSQVLITSFEEAVLSPRNKREVKFTSGVMSHDTMERIAELWPKVFDLFQLLPSKQAFVLLKELENWIIPQRLSSRVKLQPRTYALLKKHARRMLTDVLSMPSATRAWSSWAKNRTHRAKLNLRIDTDKDFEAIFGERHSLDWQVEQKQRQKHLDVIAKRLLSISTDDALAFIQKIHDEAQQFDRTPQNGHLNELYASIASKTKSLMDWIRALMKIHALPSHISPFLYYLEIESNEAYQLCLAQLLDVDEYQELAIRLIVRMPRCDIALLDKAMHAISKAQVIDHLRLYDPEISNEVMIRLLSHENPEVRAMAAMCEWHRDPQDTVKPELETIWRQSLLDVSYQSHDLHKIFQKYPELAFPWLRRQLQRGDRLLSDNDIAVVESCNQLTFEQRQTLICEMTADRYYDDIFDLLLGGNVALFRDWLLSHAQLEEYQRLKPLHRNIDERWSEMALVALDAGVSIQTLKEIAHPDPWEFDLSPLLGYQKLLPRYQQLSCHADLRLREIGRHGVQIIQDKMDRLQNSDRDY